MIQLFHCAVVRGNFEFWREVIDQTFACSTMTELHQAIANKNHDLIQTLLKDGAPTEVKNASGLTPLHIACIKKDVETVELLIRYVAHAFI